MEPATSTIDIALIITPATIDVTPDLTRPMLVDVQTSSPIFNSLDPPAAASLRITRARPRVTSFTFTDPAPAPKQSLETAPASVSSSPPRPLSPSGSQTRLQPPRDVVKLQDRLRYLLQPPLETLLASDELHFPFVPFSYQFQGVAFLYPRYSAVLADEMGLGKTMQAITAIRMLLRSGEARSVLLICPKPLVTNWRREFNQWAPEIPLAIIEGDAAKRRWQWQQDQTPVKVANYELLMRDREVLDEGLAFDLVVLDEAQRIKNTGSTTSQIVRSIHRTRSWALTGTPIENTPDDLVGIFEFLSPGYLRPGTPPRRMGELVRDHILRRTKEMVLTDLPPKMFRDA